MPDAHITGTRTTDEIVARYSGLARAALAGDTPRDGGAFRVLRPGGRLGVSDIIAEPGLDPDERAAAEQHIGCAASTLTAEEYRRELHAAGFTGITITPTADTGDGLHAAIVQAAKPAG